jgi:hypothetical protein
MIPSPRIPIVSQALSADTNSKPYNDYLGFFLALASTSYKGCILCDLFLSNHETESVLNLSTHPEEGVGGVENLEPLSAFHI